MQIYGPFRLSTTQAATGPGSPAAAGKSTRASAATPTPNRAASPVDQLDLSSAATSTNRVSGNAAIAGGGEIRVDRVADIRRQIADGSYDTPAKFEAAFSRMLDELA